MDDQALRRAAGRVLIVGFSGPDLPDPLARLASEGALGGVILFKRNLGTLPEVASLVRRLHALWPAGDAPLVAIDQEGGRVARLGAPLLRLPPMRVLGEIDDPDLTRRAARVLGSQLRALGIGVDFAPVLDVDTNPDNPVIGDRSFGRDAGVVTRHGLAFAAGLAEAGVVACGKHFPGHGDTELDSHLALPTIAHDRARLEAVELAPFRAARGALPTLMTAHVVFEALDPGVPATMSKKAIDGILRQELGYDGVVISDDLEMKAVHDKFPMHEVVERALNAGVDAFLACKELKLQHEVIEHIVRAVEGGRVPRARLEEAAARMTRLQQRYACSADSIDPLLAARLAGIASHRAVAERFVPRA